MNSGRPLFWHQGLLLQPHHFQQQDGFFQSMLSPFHRLIQPYWWGAASIDIVETALANRTFSLAQGEFIFPDHTHVTYPGNAVLESRSFKDEWPEGDQPLRVYLGLRQMNAAGENVTVIPAMEKLYQVPTRFAALADPENLADLHQAGPPAKIQLLRYVLKLFWESELDQLGDYVLLPLVQLERSGESILLSGHFIPPCLTLSAYVPLARIVREIRDQIASRGSQLESYKRDRGIHTAEFGARDMVYLLALRSLNRYIPQLQHMTESGLVHPWVAFGLIRQLIGELSSFSANLTVLGVADNDTPLVAPYDHRNLYPCFSQAQALVTRLLDEITAGPDYVIPLRYDGTYLCAELSPAMFEGRNRFYLVCETEAEGSRVIKSLETIAKLASRETLPILIARALPGIKLQHLPLPPQELPRRARSVYFQIDHQSDQWARVQKGNNLALFWDTAPEDIKMELMIVGRS
jgi:type VI secretion system protein ImpJ